VVVSVMVVVVTATGDTTPLGAAVVFGFAGAAGFAVTGDGTAGAPRY
jgi:hypothetical protein